MTALELEQCLHEHNFDKACRQTLEKAPPCERLTRALPHGDVPAARVVMGVIIVGMVYGAVMTTAPLIPSLKERIRALRRNAGRTAEEVERSAFAYVLGHLESIALAAACDVLKSHGFVEKKNWEPAIAC